MTNSRIWPTRSIFAARFRWASIKSLNSGSTSSHTICAIATLDQTEIPDSGCAAAFNSAVSAARARPVAAGASPSRALAHSNVALVSAESNSARLRSASATSFSWFASLLRLALTSEILASASDLSLRHSASRSRAGDDFLVGKVGILKSPGMGWLNEGAGCWVPPGAALKNDDQIERVVVVGLADSGT